jgi:hypothetical protein
MRTRAANLVALFAAGALSMVAGADSDTKSLGGSPPGATAAWSDPERMRTDCLKGGAEAEQAMLAALDSADDGVRMGLMNPYRGYPLPDSPAIRERIRRMALAGDEVGLDLLVALPHHGIEFDMPECGYAATLSEDDFRSTLHRIAINGDMPADFAFGWGSFETTPGPDHAIWPDLPFRCQEHHGTAIVLAPGRWKALPAEAMVLRRDELRDIAATLWSCGRFSHWCYREHGMYSPYTELWWSGPAGHGERAGANPLPATVSALYALDRRLLLPRLTSERKRLGIPPVAEPDGDGGPPSTLAQINDDDSAIVGWFGVISLAALVTGAIRGSCRNMRNWLKR